MRSMRYVENDVCVCGVWSVLCFNFVTAQKYIGLEGQVNELRAEKERMTLVCAVCVWCVCGVCVVCVRCVCGACGIILAFHTGSEGYAGES